MKEHDPKTGKMVTALTPLFLVLILVNVADAIFAVELGAGDLRDHDRHLHRVHLEHLRHPGLRALYFALPAMIDRFAYLKYALAAVLMFIGSKIIVADMLGIAKVPPAISLGATFGILARASSTRCGRRADRPPRP